eukprot:TRINITY_DN2490_c0_g1_i4.p1 TRINITY_DN2490_c0_g1~~TRINITY_DN2490_c0_g1_i4.p1  ORF type:complete len:271 (+),score=97.40 TRINITY_DN2490_c0_g1_i4:93-815(+)
MGLEDSFIVDHSAPTSKGFESPSFSPYSTHADHHSAASPSVVHIVHHAAAPIRVEIHQNTSAMSLCGSEGLHHFFREDYSILLRDHMTEGEFRDIIQTSNNIVFRNFGSARKYLLIFFGVFALLFALFFFAMFGAMGLMLMDPFSPNIFFYFVPCIIIFALLFTNMLCVMPFIIFFGVRKSRQMEIELRQYLDTVNNDHLIPRGVQIRLDNEVGIMIDHHSHARRTSRYMLVIDIVPRSV